MSSLDCAITWNSGMAIKFVYFFEERIGSIVAEMATGREAEAGILGHEARPERLPFSATIWRRNGLIRATRQNRHP
jgi:hypothetical protein